MRSLPDLQYRVCTSSWGMELKAYQRAAGYPYYNCTTTAHTSISHHSVITAVHRFYSFAKLFLVTLPPEVCLTPSGTMRTCQQRGGVLVNITMVSSCLVTKVCGVFNNRTLASSSTINQEHWQQPLLSSVSLGYLWPIALEVLSFLDLPLGFLFVNICLPEEARFSVYTNSN